MIIAYSRYPASEKLQETETRNHDGKLYRRLNCLVFKALKTEKSSKIILILLLLKNLFHQACRYLHSDYIVIVVNSQ